VDRRQAQLPRARVDEAVRLAWRTDHDVASVDNHRPVADPKGRLARLDHEDLGVGVPMELRSSAGLGMHEDDGEGNITMLSADELVRMRGVLELGERNNGARVSALIGQDSLRLPALLTWLLGLAGAACWMFAASQQKKEANQMAAELEDGAEVPVNCRP